MTRIFAAALVATATLAGAASAMTNSSINGAQVFAPNTDLSTLSSVEVNKIKSILIGGGTDSEKRAAVRSVLR